jgi:transposase
MQKSRVNSIETIKETARVQALKIDALEAELQAEIERRGLADKQSQQIQEQSTHYQERAIHYKDEYERLVQSLIQTNRDRFGKKSERFIDEHNPQLRLFETPGSEPSKTKRTDDDEELISYRRKKNTHKNSGTCGIPIKDVIIPVAEADRVCECGCVKTCIRYEETQRLHYQPAVIEIINEKREVLACKKGCQNQMIVAPLPQRILPRSKATESLVAHIAVSKVLDRQPLYHLEKRIEEKYNWRIPRQTMARWLIEVSEKLQPLVNLMKDELIAYDIAAMDATTLQVLNEPNRKAETKSYAHCIRGGPPGKAVTIYEYNAYSQQNYVTEVFLDYHGYIHCDAAPVFNEVGKKEGVRLSYCHAHARRKFEQVYKANRKNNSNKPTLAKEALRMYKQLYEIERNAKDLELNTDEIYQLRQEKSKPLLMDHYQWLLDAHDNTLPKSPIGKAIAYSLNHWDGLLTYLDDGRLDMDNNATERDIKPFVMARKNFLFACTQSGADSLGVLFSLIITARHHGLEPYHYMKTIFEKIPLCKSWGDYEALLPWNLKNSH